MVDGRAIRTRLDRTVGLVQLSTTTYISLTIIDSAADLTIDLRDLTVLNLDQKPFSARLPIWLLQYWLMDTCRSLISIILIPSIIILNGYFLQSTLLSWFPLLVQNKCTNLMYLGECTKFILFYIDSNLKSEVEIWLLNS